MRQVQAWGALGLAALVVLLACASVLPLIGTNAWWIRYLDFPRVQIAVVLGIVLIIYLAVAGRWRVAPVAVLSLGLAALSYHAYRLHPYMPFMPQMAVDASSCDPASRLRIMVLNVKRENHLAEDVLARVAAVDPDLLLLMETDAWRDEALAPLDHTYPRSVQHIPQDARFYGLHLYARLELIDPEISLDYGPDTPAVRTGVVLPLQGHSPASPRSTTRNRRRAAMPRSRRPLLRSKPRRRRGSLPATSMPSRGSA